MVIDMIRKTRGWQSRLAAYLAGGYGDLSDPSKPVCAAFTLGAVRVMTEHDVFKVDLMAFADTASALASLHDTQLYPVAYADHLALLETVFSRKESSPQPGDIAAITGYNFDVPVVGIVQGASIYTVGVGGRLHLLPLIAANHFYEVP